MYKEFRIVKELPIHELQASLTELVHEPTGARVIDLKNDDPENLFCLSFQTRPSSSDGVAHILEHTVLCGSKKFPIKDPFFSMMRRSLNTYMNALTGSDFTCYPAASQVEQDFYNLLEVYLDAVFHPELKELSFLQEGCRLEFTEAKDPTTPLIYKGIVFNEMKGAMASQDARLWHALIQNLVPELPYAHNSGGTAEEIPNLTYEELVGFYKSFYHPSRCLFFFYGNLPLEKKLAFIRDKALTGIEPLTPLAPLPRQTRFKEPRRTNLLYPATEGSSNQAQSLVAFGFLTAPLLEQEELLALTLLDSILMDTDASPLKHALITSGLCRSADAYMDADMSEVPLVIICKGCEKNRGDALERLLRSSLETLILKGIDPSHVESSLHQMELSRTEITGNQTPFGLTLFMRSALAAQHGAPVENGLMIHSLFEKLRKKVADPQFLIGLIKKHLLENPHLVRIEMNPDPILAEKESSQEKERLHKIQEVLTGAQKEAIIKTTEKLSLYQKEKEGQSLDCLPEISLDAIPLLTRDFTLKTEQKGPITLFHHNCFTNQILYADLIFDLPAVEQADLPYLQLLLSLIPELGVGSRSYQENLHYMHAHTGGVTAFVGLYTQTDHPKTVRPAIGLHGKALYRKSDKLLTLYTEIIQSLRLDEKERIEELVMQQATRLENRLTQNALRYGLQLAASSFSPVSFINEQCQGLTYYKMIQKVAQNKERLLPDLIQRLNRLKEELLFASKPNLILSCTQDLVEALEKKNWHGLMDLPYKEPRPWKDDYLLPSIESQGRPITSPVAFTVEAFQVCSYTHPHSPALHIAALLCDNLLLHQKIREEGGAYGADATYSAITGVFNFHTYRDPHLATSVTSFHEAIDLIASGNFKEKELSQAKLGIIQHFDAPVAPGNRAMNAYTQLREGRSKAMRQQYRNKLLSLSIKEVAQAVEKELLPKKGAGTLISFASQEMLMRENKLLAKPLSIIPI